MNQTSVSVNHATEVTCGVLRAGNQIALALDQRLGRYPLQLVHVSPLYWVCADGVVEAPAIDATPDGQAMRLELEHEILCGGLLVTEMGTNELGPINDYWTMQSDMSHCERVRERA